MADVKLATVVDSDNPVEHDLYLDPAGNLVLVDGQESVAQQLRIRFQFFLGEWFLDSREGVPYFQDVLIKNWSKAKVRAIFSRVITGTPGIASLDDFTFQENRATRELSFSFKATLDTGETFTSEDFGSFLVEV